MKVLRYSAIAAVAIFAAACGDKVTVAGPTAVTLTSTTTTTTTPVVPGKINSIAVAPAAVTLTIGQAVTLVAAVNADPGVALTVTWSSSDATKASVSTAGLVTALAATPGVAICATSTVNVGVKGCASAVVVAASATVPATVSIAGVYGSSTTSPINPASVTGSVSAMVNVDPGTETVSKVYLKIGTVVADSQVFSAAQSAALRNAVETANEAGAQAAGDNMADASASTILLTFNSAAYNATTGAVSYANGTAALSVVVYVGTTARATATYSTNLTLNNTDAVYGSWTLPSTKVQAADAAGYQWTSLGGGAMTLDIVPVIFSGKTVSSATVKWDVHNATGKVSCAYKSSIAGTGVCFSTTAFGDTAQVRTVTTLPGSASFSLWDRDMLRQASGGTSNAYVVAPPIPTISLVYSDGSTRADSTVVAKAGTNLALRVDNRAPADPTIGTPLRGATEKLYRNSATWNQRPGSSATAGQLTDADSSSLITNVGIDNGVSYGAAFKGELNGQSWKVYIGAAQTAAADSLAVTTTPITAASAMTEGSFYCLRVQSSDKLGNLSLYPDQSIKTAGGAIVNSTCASFGGQSRGHSVDNTAPVSTWSGIAGGDWSSSDTATATAFAAGTVNYFSTISEVNQGTDSISVCQYQNVSNVMTVTSYLSSDATSATCVKRSKGTGSGTNRPIMTAATQANQISSSAASPSLATLAGQIVITTQHYDAAGNVGNKLTRIVLYDPTAPTASTATVASVLLGDAPSVASFLNDGMSIANYASEMTNVSAYAASAGNGSTALAAFVGTYTTSEGTGYPVLRSAYTATTDGISTAPYQKFLNQSVSVTAPAIQYLVRYPTTVMGSPTYNEEALGAAAVSYRLMALDHAGNRSLALAYTQPTISNAYTVSTLAGTGGSTIAGASGAVTSIALDAAYSYSTDFAASASAVSGNRVLSSSVRVKVSYYTKHDANSAFWNNKKNSTGWVYCTSRSSATGGSPLMYGSASSPMGESSSAQASPAPVSVDLYLPIRGGASNVPTYQYYASASVLTSTTVAGTPSKNCGDITTATYALTVTPTDRAFQNYTSGTALWVVRHTNGFASVLGMGIGYNR